MADSVQMCVCLEIKLLQGLIMSANQLCLFKNKRKILTWKNYCVLSVEALEPNAPFKAFQRHLINQPPLFKYLYVYGLFDGL